MPKKRKKSRMAPETCENCRWWRPLCDTGTLSDYDPDRHVGAGECWRYPPRVLGIPGIDPEADACFLQPETGVIARCGEFAMMGEPRRTE